MGRERCNIRRGVSSHQYKMILRLTTALLILLQIVTAKGITGELNSACQRDEDCSVENSKCLQGKCHCLPYYATYNGTKCLQSTLLGFDCLVNEQCSMKVANSSCIGGICHCEQGFLQFRRHTCLTPAKLGDVCYGDTHCRLWDTGTYCDFLIPKLFGRCVCTTPLRQGTNGLCIPPRPLRTPGPTTKPKPLNGNHQTNHHISSAIQRPYAASYSRTTPKPISTTNSSIRNSSSIFQTQKSTVTNIFVPTTISYTKPIITTSKPLTYKITTNKKPIVSTAVTTSHPLLSSAMVTVPSHLLQKPETNDHKNASLIRTPTTTAKPYKISVTTNIPFLPTSLDNVIPKRTTTSKSITTNEKITSSKLPIITSTVIPTISSTNTTTQRTVLNNKTNNINSNVINHYNYNNFISKPSVNRRPPHNNKTPLKRPFKPSLALATSLLSTYQSHAPIKEAVTSTTTPPTGNVPFGRGEEGGVISLGLPCTSDRQCRSADSASRCVHGVCDCAIKTNSSNGNSCSAANRGCHPGTFQCISSGTCISWYFVCDGRRDCPDGSDETCQGNLCPSTAFTCHLSSPRICVSSAARCNGVRDCPHGEDESDCLDLSNKGCPVGTFRCDSGKCLPGYEFCNAVITCQDASDEGPACTGVLPITTSGFCPFRCANGRCRSSAVACSGRDGCGDGSDEEKCSVCKCPSL